MSEERRSLDPILITLQTQFIDFMDRYERDQESSKEWRIDTTKRLKIHCDFINEVSPIYKRLCWVLGLAVIVAVGLAVTSFFGHLTWS